MKKLTQVLNETASFVSATTGDKNILTKNGFRNILAEPSLRVEYVNRLTEGFSADHREVLGSLMNRTLEEAFIQESYDTLSPFQALSLPLLRVLWPYNSLKDGIQTIVATAPTFLLTAKHYYLVKRDLDTGIVERYELPQNSAKIANSPHGELVVKAGTELTQSAGAAAFAFNQTIEMGGQLTTDVQVSGLTINGQGVPIPKHGWNTGGNIVVNFVDVGFDGFAHVVTTENTHESDVTVDAFLNGNLILMPNLESGDIEVFFSGVKSADMNTLVNVATEADPATSPANEEAMVSLLTAFVITLSASKTERWNENNWGFEYQTKNFSVTIPDGKRVSTALPVELVQDIKALYQLDAASEFGNGMRMLFGDAFDIEGVNYFVETINSAYPGKLAAARNFSWSTLDTTDAEDHATPIKIFNTQPQIGYMGDLVQWRSNTMKDLIRLITTTLEKEWYIKFGKVTLFANPIVSDLLHGVDWVFEPGLAADGDVTADYSVGTFRSASRMYKMISSQRVQEDILWVLLTPSEQDVMTLRYYPYYFGLETGSGYRDPNYPNVPSVSFIRRHKYERYVPALGALVVHNNIGSPYYKGFKYPST